MHNAFADFSQVFVHHIAWIFIALVGWTVTVQNLLLQVKELLRIELDLEFFLLRIVMKILNHPVLQHHIFVLNFAVNLSIQYPDRVIRILVIVFNFLFYFLLFHKDVSKPRLMPLSSSSEHFPDLFILI